MAAVLDVGRHIGQIVGRSPWLQPVHVAGGHDLIGTIGRVRIESTSTNSLFGTLVGAQQMEAAS